MNAPLPQAVQGVALDEIAKALGVHRTSAFRRADKESWAYQEVTGRGGAKRLYPLASLPKPVQDAIRLHQLNAHSATLPVTLTTEQPLVTKTDPNSLTDEQRHARDARKAVLSAIAMLQVQTNCSKEAAMHTLLVNAQAGKLDAALDTILRTARAKRGRTGNGYPSIRTLKRWLSADDLAPKQRQKDMTVPPWGAALLKLYGQPQKPSLAQCVDELPEHLPAGVTAPDYHKARRFIEKLGNVERQRGRRLSRDIKNILPFVRRDSSHMLPGDCYTADGHKFDAEVAHPKHGRPFRPELTSVLDIATRKCVGWSAGLAESTWAVMDAQRHAIETHGICSLWYVDNGGGFKNAMQSDEVIGFAARIGTTITHSLPYNSQARGVEERSHQSIWVRAAKTLPTFIGADMDAQAKNKVFKLTRADIRAAGSSRLLMPWDTFLAWCAEAVAAYNDRPHRGLPKIRDDAGKSRHMTPNEAWQKAIDEGFEPVMVTSDESADLFRPYTTAKVLRGEIRLFNNLYFSHNLTEWHGEILRVGYDIHDPSRVWVRDNDGRLITTAELDGNRRAYFPESVIQQAERRRAQGRERRLLDKLEEVQAELNPPAMLEHIPTMTLPVQMPAAIEGEALRIGGEEKTSATVTALPVTPQAVSRPWFDSDPDQYRWLMQNPSEWTADDADWLLGYVGSEDYEDLAQRYAFQGVAWSNADSERAESVLKSFEVAAG